MLGAGFDSAHLAGNSLDGWIALELARRGRARARGPAAQPPARSRGERIRTCSSRKHSSTPAARGSPATLPHALHAQPRGLTTLDVPVLILWGNLDLILLPRQGRRFERLIPGAELRYVRGAGHVPMTDVPELLAEAITDFALDRKRAGDAAQAASTAAGS
jgi:pimeloyl-ACP methyl ester carboxylesterase